MNTVPIFLILYLGFVHAFETDHLLAVSNIVVSRNKIATAIKDGFFWGLGHTSTIIIISLIVLLLKFNIAEYYFKYFDIFVGFMLIILGFFRLYKWYKNYIINKNNTKKIEILKPTHSHSINKIKHQHAHLPAYGIGLLHGLAGSGELIIAAMTKMKTVNAGLFYLLIFGLGSIFGMMSAAGIFSLPFSQKFLHNKILQSSLIIISAILCIGFGWWWVYHNLK